MYRKELISEFKPRLRPIDRVNTGSWIVQRLNKPKKSFSPYGNTIEFDNKDSAHQVARIFSTDYMGAFEYEHGSLGQSMSRMYDNAIVIAEYQHNDFYCYVVYTINTSWSLDENNTQLQTIKSFIDESYSKGMSGKEVAKNDYGSFYKQVKGEWHNKELIGWFDLQNDFAWFLDKKTANGFLNLFTAEGRRELWKL